MKAEGSFVDIGQSADALRALLVQLLIEVGGTIVVSRESTAKAVALGDVRVVAKLSSAGMVVSLGAADERGALALADALTETHQ